MSNRIDDVIKRIEGDDHESDYRGVEGGLARWGRETHAETRKLISVSGSLVDEFRAAYPDRDRRTGADAGIRYAIDHKEEIIGSSQNGSSHD